MLFSKMHGLGNDFVILDGMDGKQRDYVAMGVPVCDRHMGIGADGLVVVLPSARNDVRMRVINSDGSEAQMCGNAIRCFAKYVFEKGIIQTPKFSIETLAGVMEPEILFENGVISGVRVNMGKPGLQRGDIPMQGASGRVINEPLDIDGRTYYITSMLMGVPHTVIFVDSFDEREICELGAIIERHPLFPQRTNVNFVRVVKFKEIEVCTWERGAGRTMACGTGSCASVVAAFLNGYTGRNVCVHLAYGDLTIEWAHDDVVYMCGPAEESFVGEFDDEYYAKQGVTTSARRFR